MFRKTAQIQRVLNLEILTGALYATDLQPTESFLIFHSAQRYSAAMAFGHA